MAWSPDYATVEDLRSFVRIPDTEDDAVLAMSIAAASRAIDRQTGRQFGNAEGTRRYKVVDGITVIDDITRVDSVTLNGAEVTPELWPLNAEANGKPYERLSLPRDGALEVTGLFGWPVVPEAVKYACLLQANRVRARRDSPFGIAGSADGMGELRLLSKVDPDVAVILASFRRWWGAV